MEDAKKILGWIHDMENAFDRNSDTIKTLKTIRDLNKSNDSGRHISLAITHLEDANYRIQSAVKVLEGLIIFDEQGV